MLKRWAGPTWIKSNAKHADIHNGTRQGALARLPKYTTHFGKTRGDGGKCWVTSEMDRSYDGAYDFGNRRRNVCKST